MNLTFWRATAVWLLTTAAAAVVIWWTLSAPSGSVGSPGSSGAPGSAAAFGALLARVAALALAACAGWAWAVTTTVLVSAAVGATRAPGVPAWAGRVVLAACGLALATSATPALAAPAEEPPPPIDPVAGALVGLQLPDRTTGPAHGLAGLSGPLGRSGGEWSADRPAGGHLRVRAGDSLWRIAADLLPEHAGAGEIAALTDRLHALNRVVIGDDPDLITPGQLLRKPSGLRADRREESP